MFTGFQIQLGESEFSEYSNIFDKNIYYNQKEEIRGSLNQYIYEDGTIQATKVIEDWFPTVEADVFLSHSHGDEEIVQRFAGFLYQKFGIVSFIDSSVWGYADELLKKIDDKYCRQAGSSHSYDYDTRNRSTSHVHMMLNSALMNMIDRTECLIFVNTPNSISTDNIRDKEQVASPWIYSELLYSRLLRKKVPERLKGIFSKSLYHFDEGFDVYANIDIRYDISTDHLFDIDQGIFDRWTDRKCNNADGALNKLYRVAGIIK